MPCITISNGMKNTIKAHRKDGRRKQRHFRVGHLELFLRGGHEIPKHHDLHGVRHPAQPAEDEYLQLKAAKADVLQRLRIIECVSACADRHPKRTSSMLDAARGSDPGMATASSSKG